MKKLLILALASAFVAAANAADVSWFSANSSGPTGAEWSSTPVVENNVISVDTDVGSKLTLNPTATKPSPEVKTVVEVQAAFTAASDYSSLESPGNDAKTALTVAKDGDVLGYYYWDSAESDPNVNKWKPIEGLTPTLSETPVTVTFELDNSSTAATTARITIGDESGKAVTVDLAADTTLSALAFAGTGTLKSVDATVTPAYAKYNNTRYATTADAVTAKGNGTGDITMYAPVEAGKYDLYDDANEKVYYYTTSGNVTTLAGVFPASGAGTAASPYTINNLAELKAFQQYVDKKYTTANKYFKQTADIDMANAGAFAGIGTDSKPFAGVYDGNDKTISNVTFTPRTYSGVFNSVNNATIKNLKVDTVGFANDADGEYGGAAIVGKIAGTSTLTNLVAKGSVGSLEKLFTHNAAGVAVRVTGGNVTIADCHNEAAVYGAYSKLAGIINLVQADSGSVVITNCSNSGAITASGTFVNDNKTRNAGDNGVAGILSYANMPVTITDCSNTGALTGPSDDGGAKIGQIVGWVQGKTLTDGGSNCASSAQGMIGHKAGGTVTGFQYATVNNNVATTIAPPYTLTKDTTYLLEGNVGAGTVFTLAAAGDTIAFNTALGYTFGGTVAAAQGLVAKSTTSGTVTTYKADEGYEVVSTAETTLVAVPANCNAAGLISTDNRDTGDILKVYSKGDKCYYTWTLTGAKGTWTPLQTWVINGEAAATSHSKPASEVGLSAGQAAWLTRTSAASKNAKIILAVVAEGNTIPAIVEKGYNLVAPPPKAGASTITIDEVVADDATGKDKVFIPAEGKAPYNLDFKDGQWGYDKYTIENGQLKKVRITDVTIPAGTGFFYINNGDAAKSVTLGSED